MKRTPGFAIFLTSLLFLVTVIAVVAGFAIAYSKSPPTALVGRALSYAKTFLETGVVAPENLFLRRLPEAPEAAFYLYDGAAAPSGWRAFMIYNLERDFYVVDLYDPMGKKVWSWPVADPEISGSGGGDKRIHPHGLVVRPDGSILINGVADAKILASYDRCGAPNWVRREYFHHLMTPDSTGSVWTWLGVESTYSQEQIITRFDPETGETLQEIALIKDVLQGHPDKLDRLGLPHDFHQGPASLGETRYTDLFHTNDVEPLRPEMADAFEMFEAGDLLLSLRNMDLVMVLDPDDMTIKWHSHGPWLHQHDPDFTPDGRIIVYNNNFASRYEERSAILSVDPATGAVESLFNAPEFFSARMGQQQQITPRVWHVSVPHQGRAFEVDIETDRILFEFNNQVLEGHNGHLANSVWLPEDFFDESPTTYSCPG